MSLKKVRKILISPEQSKAPLGTFFQNIGFELCSQLDEATHSSYEFIVDDFLPEMVKVPRLFTQNPKAFLNHPSAFSYFDPNFLENEQIQFLIRTSLSEDPDFNLVSRYSKEAKNILTLKVQDYFSLGYFIDQIVLEAYKNKYPVEQMREYLNGAFNYCFSLLRDQQDFAAIELSYSNSTNGFALDMSMAVTEYKMDKTESIFERLSQNTNCLIVDYFKKRERIQLSSLWFKESKFKGFHSCFFVETFTKMHHEAETPDAIVLIDAENKAVEYQPDAVSPEETKMFFIARKLALYIKSVRSKEIEPKEHIHLNVEDVDFYLSKHPHQGIGDKLDEDTKKLILNFLMDDNLGEAISDYVQNVVASNLDPIVDDVERVLGNKSLEDMIDAMIVSGKKNGTEQGVMRVKAWAQNLTEETWKVQRSKMVQAIKDEFKAIKADGRNFVEEDMIRVVCQNIDAEPEDVAGLVRALIEEVASEKLLRKEPTEDGFALLLKTRTLEEERNKQDTQILKMKKIIDQMKIEVVNLREQVKELNETRASSEVEKENLDLKIAFGKSLEAVREKDQSILASKLTFDKILESKENGIKRMEDKIGELRQKIAGRRQENGEDRIDQLVMENKTLATKLEIATSKLSIISENTDRQKGNDQQKREAMVKRFSAEKTILDEKYRNATLELKKAELKLKNMATQLEDLQKNKVNPTQATKTADFYVKQVESLNERINEANKDISEKKKENFKLRHENNGLLSKVAELEKKLFMMDKKAS